MMSKYCIYSFYVAREDTTNPKFVNNVFLVFQNV